MKNIANKALTVALTLSVISTSVNAVDAASVQTALAGVADKTLEACQTLGSAAAAKAQELGATIAKTDAFQTVSKVADRHATRIAHAADVMQNHITTFANTAHDALKDHVALCADVVRDNAELIKAGAAGLGIATIAGVAAYIGYKLYKKYSNHAPIPVMIDGVYYYQNANGTLVRMNRMKN